MHSSGIRVYFGGFSVKMCAIEHAYIREVVKKLSKSVPIIYRIKSSLNAQCLKILYYAIIYPNYIYCVCVWAGTYKSTMNSVFIAQKGNIRANLGVTRRTSSGGLFHELCIMETRKFLMYVTVTYVFRSLKNPNLDDFSLQLYKLNTRPSNQRIKCLPDWVLECRRGLRFRRANLFNGLPVCLKQSGSYNSIKYGVKQVLAGNGVV